MPHRQEVAADRSFTAHAALAGQTVAAALRKWLPKFSWSQVQKLIAGRQVMVSGNLCTDAGRRLKDGEVVKLLANPAPALPREDDLTIKYLDAHVVVVEKPSGMTTIRHREEKDWPSRRKQIQPTLDEHLPHVIRKIEGRGSQRGTPVPLRAVHRLDRETSGLLVFARTHPAERALALQFRKHTTHRRYLAVVEGAVEARTIESRLVRDRGDGRRGSTAEPNVGKAATTHIKPIERLGDYTLIECRLETGRTHQIRIHLSEAGHIVCGEKVYRQPLNGKPVPDRSGAPRLALHAAELGFLHPLTGKPLRFQSPLPPELKAFVEQLREKAKLSTPR